MNMHNVPLIYSVTVNTKAQFEFVFESLNTHKELCDNLHLIFKETAFCGLFSLNILKF